MCQGAAGRHEIGRHVCESILNRWASAFAVKRLLRGLCGTYDDRDKTRVTDGARATLRSVPAATPRGEPRTPTRTRAAHCYSTTQYYP